MLSTGLASRDIRRIEIEDGKVVGETRIPVGTTRMRDLEIGTDGTLSDTEVSFPVAVMTERSGPDGNIVRGQGGLLDIAASPNFADDKLLFFTYATGKLDANRTGIGRGRVDGRRP